MESKKNKQSKQKQTHRYREQTDGCQTGGGSGGWMKKVKGLRSTNWQLHNSHGNVNYSIGNTVNNTIITMYGARAVDLLGRDPFFKLYKYKTTTLDI